MKFGYARVSKNEQSLDVQIQKLTAAGCDEIFQEKISGAKDDRGLRQVDKMSVKQICDTIGVSRSVFYRCINEHADI